MNNGVLNLVTTNDGASRPMSHWAELLSEAPVPLSVVTQLPTTPPEPSHVAPLTRVEAETQVRLK